MLKQVELKPAYKTTEFFTIITAAVTNLVFVLTLVGYLTPADRDQLMSAVTTLLAAAEIMVANGLLIWQFIAARTKVKTAATVAAAAYNEAVLKSQEISKDMSFNPAAPLAMTASPTTLYV